MKILVIGDAILDRYVWGLIKRQSPEDSTVPVVDFVDEEYRLGGCLNVAANIKALGKRKTEVYVSSILSDYTASLLKERKIGYDEIVLKTKDDKIPHVRELIKTRIVNSMNAKQIVRLDNKEKFSESDIMRFKNKCYYHNFVGFDAIVVSDYEKGLIDESIINGLLKVHCPVFVDTKKKDLSIWKNIKKCYVKVNKSEYENATKCPDLENLIVTEGGAGSSYFKKGLLDSFYKITSVEDADVVGAGDVFIAGFVVAFLENKEIGECLAFANKVAALSVTKFGTSIVERNEI
jgi:D-beta-D-heptose 7-phosphate kinase/D-beta-D-heptose 1-phosphate adenosyltransferase